MDERYVRERLLVETPELVDAVFGSERPAIFIGLHFGAIELPALVLSVHGRRDAVAPMETMGDPELQRWFVRTRGRVGIRIVGLREARRELVAALRRGSPVGLVADRDLTGGGIGTSFFGHSAPMPAGPALLADESGAAAFVVSVRRAGLGRYRGRLDPLPAPVEGNRRARVVGFLEAEARIFERIIADAPEQWWGCFFEIWPDVPAVPAVPALEAA
jgi:lauroyl/myristoyl acyltransferase